MPDLIDIDAWITEPGNTDPQCPECGTRMKLDIEADLWWCPKCGHMEGE